MKEYLRLIDTNTTGPRCDVTPLFADPIAFAHLVNDLSEPFLTTPLDYIVGIDALGFILATAIALRLNKGLIPIRKMGKLPVEVIVAEFVDYTGEKKGLELRKGVLKPGDKVLVVDEWIETGAQVQAAISLIEQAGGKVAGIATINIDKCPITTHLCKKYKCQALWFNMKLQLD
jgi:adenine phosphoribosyltransferase